MKRFPFARRDELEALARRLGIAHVNPLHAAFRIVEAMEKIGLDYDAPIEAIEAVCLADAELQDLVLRFYPPTREVL